MASDGEEETEYESDPEEAKMSLKMRRREASDDEDGEVGEEQEEETSRERRDVPLPPPRAGIVYSEGESDGQGGAAEYDEDYDDDEEECYDELEEEVVEDEYEQDREVGGGGAEDMTGEVGETKAVEEMAESRQPIGQDQGEEEKKENEPFAVPTSGAFYMHDDRFRDNAGGRHRRTFGGRKLWESKDDRKWGHDKFEEMNIQNRHYEEGRRSSKGYYKGRRKATGVERAYAQGNRMQGYNGNNNQNAVPKDVRGRGPTRYQPLMKSKNEVPPPQNKQSAKTLEKASHTASARTAASTNNPKAEHKSIPAKKSASNLSSASPPFYPLASSNKDITMTQKREISTGNQNRNIHPSAPDHSYPMPHSNSLWQGKNVFDSVSMDKLHIDDSVYLAGATPLNNVHLPPPTSSTSIAAVPSSSGVGRGIAVPGSVVSRPPQTNNQVNKAPKPVTQVPQRNPAQNRAHIFPQPSVQPLGQQPVGVSQSSFPPKTGKGTTQGAGRGSLVGGAQVMGSGGNMVAGLDDQNLPAFFPVMQFGGQHPGGIGVPAVGMAFPGYVAQPNGLGNSEMKWLPVLASAVGSLGATYYPPYIAVDGSYYPLPTGQTSALPALSKDNNPSKLNNELKPQQRVEVGNHEFSQRQNKPRRYSEMNFS